MYLDTVVVSGLVIIALTCAVFFYVGRFAYRRIKEDIDKADKNT